MPGASRPADEASEPVYRALIVDEAGHTIAPAKILEAKDDDEALRQARSFVDGYGVELWEGTRMIASFPPND